ncbi:ATP-dependent helicase [Bacillus thuringiensis serovar thailandensis]|nr:ATP-dependent helicase [Bacillus thuringiensis serovar thailandensis]
MAILYPEMEVVEQLKVKPTDGEMSLLKILQLILDDSYEVFFQPFLNGERPDIVVLRKKYGAVIIEVKDWELGSYRIDKSGQWYVKKDNGPIKECPLKQVVNYKNSMYDWHIEGLLEQKILNKKYYGLIKCGVYFHKELEVNAKNFLIEQDTKFIHIWGRDTSNKVSNVLVKESSLFTDELYEKIKSCLMPSFHDLESGKEPIYNKKQKQLLQSSSKHQKIKGVAGSGKTLVLARRCVNAYKRTGGRVLVLTFNITLRNYIKDRISDVREDFDWANFEIKHYHLFISSKCKEHGIKVTLGSFEDTGLFSGVERRIEKYSAIFIDEIQDFKFEWQQIIKKYFLEEGGEFVLLGDEKQNIYNRELEEDKKVKTTISGAWNQLNTSYRLTSRISDVAIEFQKYFFKEKYELDNIDLQEQLQLTLDDGTQLHYYFIKKSLEHKTYIEFFKIVYNIIEKLDAHRNDLCFLGTQIELLRELDYYIRLYRKEKTTRTFESKEVYEQIKEHNDCKRQLEKLRRERKYNFWMNGGTTKVATIHSFKGWEINNLVLFVAEDINKSEDEEKVAVEELIYTGITRCRKNLIIINIANKEMQEFFSSIKEQFDHYYI